MFLTICIPTYNRCHLLQETVESVMESVEQAGLNDIEILISDNCSDDDTASTVAAMVKKYSIIRCRRNDNNVRDENFFILAREARGRYLWIFADDDLMKADAVKNVCTALLNNNNLLVLNYSIWNNDFTELILPLRYPFKKNEYFSAADTVLHKFGTGLQFISSVVMEKEYFFSERKYDYTRLHQYGNSFLYSVYAGISKDCRAYYLAEPQIKYRGFNSEIAGVEIWYKYFIYGNNFLLSLLKELHYSRKSIRKTRFGIITQYLFRDIVSRKKAHFNTCKLLSKIPAVYYSHLSFLLIGLPMILIPNPVFLFFYRLIKNN